jgi:hypothetical protein
MWLMHFPASLQGGEEKRKECGALENGGRKKEVEL